MNRLELVELISNGESSGVEFKRDTVEARDFAAEVAAFANFAGGVVLLGVEDDGTVSGTTRTGLEEWVVNACRDILDPPLIPYFTWVREVEPGRDVAVVRVLAGPDKPYAHMHQGRRRYYIRAGSTKREASREELERMFQAAGRFVYGIKPVPGAALDDLDIRRLRHYIGTVLGSAPPDDPAEWSRLLINLELMVETDGVITSTVDGMLLFGRNPKKFLPQSGVRALAYAGTSPDYSAVDEELRGPLVPLLSAEGDVVEAGLVEQALAFIERNAGPQAQIEGARRVDSPTFPGPVLREALVNALVHRDYSIAGTDVTLSLFADRLELLSPGRLPNTVTVEGLRAGARYARNQTLVNIMRDFGYVDFRGMGVRDKIIPGMREHNGTEVDLIERETSFMLRLWRTKT